MKDAVHTFDSWHGAEHDPLNAGLAGKPTRWRTMARMIAKKQRIELAKDEPGVAEDGPVLQAIINHGRWLVLCPSCLGAELAREDGLFMCMSCWNVDYEGKHLRVTFPTERRDIEHILLKRRIRAHRNWRPGYTLEALRMESLERCEPTDGGEIRRFGLLVGGGE